MYYKAIAVSTSQTVATDIFEITAPADCVVVITRINVTQSSDVGDAAAENLKVLIVRGYTTSGSGGNSFTPIKGQTGFAAAGSTVETHNTTGASSGTAVTEHEENFNIANGFDWRPAPEEYIILSPSERLVVRTSAPTDALTLSGTMYFTEIGG